VSFAPSRPGACAAASLLAVVLLTLAATACGSSASAGSPAGPVVPVTERDFRIIVPRSVAAGDLTLRVHNEGPDTHEFIIVRAGRGKLPMRSDGLTVDEEMLQQREAGSLQPGQPGATRDLHVDLRPGRYILFCNMSGHFMGGMRAVLVVR
jgi:uncharacterized cupredoxin-like copper-binding protein